MKDIFERAGVIVSKENRKDLDKIIHNIVGIEYKNCSETWREVKAKLADNEELFIDQFKSFL